MRLIIFLLKKLGFYNLESSNKYRFVKQLYDETRTMIRITALVKEIFEKDEINSLKLDFQEESDSGIESKPKIFQYWHQGFDDLPVIIKNCYASIDHYLGQDFEVIRIDMESLSNFIVLPAHILRLQENGKMSIAHFSDIVRNKLLLEYGGLWLDSTVLITGKNDISRFISLENRLMFSRFVFSNSKEHAVQFESWIMWSKYKGNKVFKIADEVLMKYWSENLEIDNYFLYHIVLTIIFLNSNDYRNMFHWNNRFYLSNSLDLGRYLFHEKFNRIDWQEIIKKTEIHKLDFKTKDYANGSFVDFLNRDFFLENVILN